MLLQPTHELTIDSFADVVLLDSEMSKIQILDGNVLMVGKCPVHWVSKLQNEVAVSMMEAEYIALSTAMQD